MIAHYKIFPGKSAAAFQITISAPKRNFKKAHDRNRIKRLLRETIRQNKLILESFLTDKDQTLALFLIYTAREELEFDILQQKTKKILNLIINEISNDTKN